MYAEKNIYLIKCSLSVSIRLIKPLFNRHLFFYILYIPIIVVMSCQVMFYMLCYVYITTNTHVHVDYSFLMISKQTIDFH